MPANYSHSLYHQLAAQEEIARFYYTHLCLSNITVCTKVLTP